MEAIMIPSVVNLKAYALGYFGLGFTLILFYVVASGVAFGRIVLRPTAFFPVPGIGVLLILALTLWALAFRTVLPILSALKLPLILGVMLSLVFAAAAWKKRFFIMQVTALWLLAVHGFLIMGVLASFYLIKGELVFIFWAWPNILGLLLWPIMMISAAALNLNVLGPASWHSCWAQSLMAFCFKHALWLWPTSLGLLAGTAWAARSPFEFTWWPLVWWGLMLAHAILAIAKRHQIFGKEIFTSISLGLLGGISLIFPQVIWPHLPGRLWWEDLTWPRPWMIEVPVTIIISGIFIWYWGQRLKRRAT